MEAAELPPWPQYSEKYSATDLDPGASSLYAGRPGNPGASKVARKENNKGLAFLLVL
jgi:hypothetical protein